MDDEDLRAATREVLAAPVDMFVATTGIGMKAWFEAAESWGMVDELVAAIGPPEILARGPKSVGALRRRGLRELWAPESECFEDVLAHLRGRDLTGKRIVVQEHGQSLSMAAHALRRQGADVLTVTVYRVARRRRPGADVPDDRPDRRPRARRGHLHLRPAVAALMDAAGSDRPPRRGGRRLPGRRRRRLRRPGHRRGLRAVGRADDPSRPLAAGRDGQAAGDRAALAQARPEPRGRPGGPCCCTATTCCSTASRSAVAGAARGAPGAAREPRHVVSRRELLAALPSGTRAPSTPSRWRSPGCAPPSAPGWCRRSSSAATGSRSPGRDRRRRP